MADGNGGGTGGVEKPKNLLWKLSKFVKLPGAHRVSGTQELTLTETLNE